MDRNPPRSMVPLSNALGWLWAAAILQLSIYAEISWLSSSFAYGSDLTQRPILLVLILFWVNFGIHIVALIVAIKTCNEQAVFRVIVLAALAFRGVMVFSEPIQEVDIYRYCWDGAVLRHGVSPFRYPPERAITADSGEAGLSKELAALIELRDSDPGLAEALARVHYGKLTTIYPPVSQLVFAAADLLTPRGAALRTRVVTMKAVIVLFDMAVIAVVSQLLCWIGMHQGWLITYAWCPLVLKEFAGSGHLDAIAVCFCCLALWAFLRGTGRERAASPNWTVMSSGLLLALGIGAKLYPVVLLPMLVAVTWSRLGMRSALLFASLTGGLALVLLWPMLLSIWSPPIDQTPGISRHDTNVSPPSAPIEPERTRTPPLPSFTDPSAAVASPEDPAGVNAVARPITQLVSGAVERDGLVTFLARWEMNDLIFMVVEENLRHTEFESSEAEAVTFDTSENQVTSPASSSSISKAEPWFVVVPNAVRTSVTKHFATWLGTSPAKTPFLLARLITLAIFSLCVLWFTLRAIRSGDSRSVLEYSFLTLAWFWLLAPTQNPWYWTWALPLLAFARGRAWLALSGLSLMYYLRFWFLYHLADQDVWLAGYPGTRFFDLILVWLEFGPWLLGLFAVWCLRSHLGRAEEQQEAVI